MKEYNKPQIECVSLRAEEGIASTVDCKIGECHDNQGNPVFMSPGGS